ncbi:hypothetical protein SAMN04488527_12225 [Aliiroseovarius crassostreae]|uniref:hypothetical protein n=1 Tax=Aliiroseovarius crassostreae TaxID=154981 RepID=UPI0008EF94C8|nr:hypothetical protein [Aliiroseovarius crassostreae]SFU84833.1 hypothetical protein SAMN04488527_12225 [Aliiroseovarius crassostreae]
MANEWIIDVLTDLMAYARRNDLSVTAEALDDARLVALTEIASAADRKAEMMHAYESQSGTAAHQSSERDRA